MIAGMMMIMYVQRRVDGCILDVRVVPDGLDSSRAHWRDFSNYRYGDQHSKVAPGARRQYAGGSPIQRQQRISL